MQKRTILSFLVAVAVCLLVLLPSAAGAEPTSSPPPAGLMMEAAPAFGGHFKFGEWLPIWVSLENSGADLDAEVRVRMTGSWGTTTFAAPVALPMGSRKRLPIYVLPNNYSHELEVQLVRKGGEEVLVQQAVPVYPRVNITYLVGLVAPERGVLALLQAASLPGQNRPLQLVDISLGELPTRVDGLRSLDCIVLNDVDTSSLAAEQKAALESWVQQGGRLVVGGGAGALRIAAGLPASLLPIVPRGDVALPSLPGLASFAGAERIAMPGPFLVATGDLAEGQNLAAEKDLPLVRERALGSGNVDWVALDLAAAPFDGWSGTTAFWEQLLAPGAAYPPWLATDMSARQMQSGSMTYALSNLPALDLPSVQWLAMLLGIYVLVVGPANYLLLRWRKRLHWAWVTIPLLTLLFAGGAFGLGYALRGSDVILNKVAVVGLQDDGNASLRSYVGLFSPSQRAYEIQISGSHLLSPLNPDYNPWGPGGLPTAGEMTFVQGDPGHVHGLAVNQWSMQALMVEGTWPAFGRIGGELSLEDQALTGRVRNDTGHRLLDSVLVLGNQFVRLGDMAPGSEAAVRFDLTSLTSQQLGAPLSYRLFEAEFNQPNPNGPPREAQLKQTLLDSLFQQGGKAGPSSLGLSSGEGLQGPIFLGWMDEAPPEVQVEGRAPTQMATGLVVAPLSYRLPAGDRVSLPPGLIVGTLTEMPQEGGFCGMPGTTAVYIGRGQAVVEFRAPLPEEIQVDRLELALRSDGGWWQAPQVAVYDWQAGAWASLGDVSLGTVAVAGAESLISDDGRVRVQMSTGEGGGGGCLYLDLGLAGTRSSRP